MSLERRRMDVRGAGRLGEGLGEGESGSLIAMARERGARLSQNPGSRSRKRSASGSGVRGGGRAHGRVAHYPGLAPEARNALLTPLAGLLLGRFPCQHWGDTAPHMLEYTVSEATPDDRDLVLRGAGQGLFAGILAALLSLWVWGLNFLILAFWYGFSLAALRSWPELAGILTMIGTTAVAGAIYDIIAMDSISLGLTIGLSILALTLFAVYVCAVVALINRARAHALKDGEITANEIGRSEHWEERYFAPLRAARAAGRSPTPILIRPVIWSVAGLLVAFWSPDGRLVSGLALGVAFFQALVFGRMAQYIRRLQQPSGESAAAETERRPILFLRPFAFDALPVSSMEGKDWNTRLNPLAWLDKRTFEEHLASTFEDLGPVIAIGRPGEEVAPLGAARQYADEASWQALALDRASQAQFVIMEVDATPGMVWEIDQVSKLVGLRRTLIVLPPGKDIFEERSSEWYERWGILQKRFEFLPSVSKETAAVLYDRNEQPVLIASHKSSVLKSLDAIKGAWIEARRAD